MIHNVFDIKILTSSGVTVKILSCIIFRLTFKFKFKGG
jgi:hypothetical protein